jgi:biopolymer transport protein ExbD
MRRSRKNREMLAVSLFPFLAVLICTLGVLIVLLVLAVKSVDVEAHNVQASRQEEVESEVKRLSLNLDTEQLRIAGLEQVRPEAVKRMANVRTHRGHLEADIRQLDKQTQELVTQLRAFETTTDQPEATTTDSELAALEQQVASAQEKLENARQRSKQAQPVTYAIVPQSGTGGTHRRPIYIECNGDGLTLQPYNVVLRRNDFFDQFSPGNPLDAALLAIREYWTKYDLAGDEGQPYPLLVIRPSGTQSYVLARRAMDSWDSEFGYEVIEEDKILDFGQADPQLREIILTAIENAKKQTVFAAAVRERRSRLSGEAGQTDRRPGLVVSGPQGGFVNENGFAPTGSGADSSQSAGRTGAGPNSQQASFAVNKPSEPVPAFGSVLDRYLESPGQPGRQAAPLANDNSAGYPLDAADATQTISMNTATTRDNTANKSATTADSSASAAQGQPPNSASSSSEGNVALSGTSSCQSLAASRGDNWALPSRTPGATGYLRPVRIYCGKDALRIQTTPDEQLTIPFDGLTENAIAPMVDGIWKMIDSWGEAGANGYWKPELRFTIQRGGEARFADLQALLDQSGFQLKGSTQ